MYIFYTFSLDIIVVQTKCTVSQRKSWFSLQDMKDLKIIFFTGKVKEHHLSVLKNSHIHLFFLICEIN